MNADDVCLNKAAIIERCIRRIRDEYAADTTLENYTHLDALTLNVERACQAAIDLGMHVVAKEHLGIPQTSADAFLLLQKAGKLDDKLARAMQGMTGFRNVAVHEYKELDHSVVRWIAISGTNDLIAYCAAMGIKIRP
jgi:uncharacterized protein YutE (UPF0331/DUF86 family)